MSLRPRPARIETVVDGHRLRAQLTAVALERGGEAGEARSRAKDLLHAALFRGRLIARDRLEDGAGGLETARLLSQVADEVIRALFDFTTTHVFRSRNPTEGERFCIVAVGGYGRGQLAPSSDIDLLFLRAYKQTPFAESVTEYMLYMLWDMSLKVGHASRSVDECLKLAKDDHTVQTALLEARFLAGDHSLFEQFHTRFRRDVVEPGHRAFVQAKLKERDARHARAGQTRYLVEPNIKEGKGGIRDLHVILWVMRHFYDFDAPMDYLRAGVFTRDEVSLFLRASDFLWRVRSHLHFLTGRPEERLTFDVQPELAARLGYKDRSREVAVERFMKRYFLAAKEVGVLTRVMEARLDVEEAKRELGLSRFLGAKPKPKSLGGGFVLDAGRVGVESPSVLDADPNNLVRLFAVADTHNADVTPAAFAEVTRRLRRINAAVRRDPVAIAQFLAVAASPRAPARTLKLMTEAGVLGRFLPEFGRIVAQMQFNMYHHYTVDEHTLRAIQVISDIEQGRCQQEHPLATAIFPKIINRRALYLAMLLHDTGKGIGDQQEEGAKVALTACERLGLPIEESELVAWLVGRHLIMSDVAQKRDIADPRTVAAFAQEVGTLERLRLLLVLTVADIRAVGPGVWNGWKGQLLRDLYRLTEAAFHGGRTDEASVAERLAAQAQEKRLALVSSLATPIDPRLPAWLESLEDAYWVSFEEDALRWHLEAAAAALRQADSGVTGPYVAARPDLQRGVTELLVYARDRLGLFADIAACLAAAGADVHDARVHTSRDGLAFDVVSILDSGGKPFGHDDPQALARLMGRVATAAVSGAPRLEARKDAGRRTAAFQIAPWVRVDNDLSQTSTVIEVSGRDRPGLLAQLAAVLAEAGLSIVSAHIDAYGERVADVFYVQETDGEKLEGAARAEVLKARLESVLREDEPGAPTAAKQRLAVARASTGR
jgi:[protein-PII] uridylyltransferase